LATVKPIKAQRGATRLSPATVRRIMTPVKAMLSEAYELNVTPINAGKVRVIVHANEGRGRRTAPKTLAREEIAAVLAELADRDRLLFYVLARTGLRIVEVLESPHVERAEVAHRRMAEKGIAYVSIRNR
jgi:integrase